MSSFEIFVDHTLKLVKITAWGELFQADGEKIITLARTTAAEHSYNVLYDIRRATSTVPFASWFNMPRELPVFRNAKAKRVSAAVLVSPQDKAVKDYEFYETVITNLGMKLRVFFDETEALGWLNINILVKAEFENKQQ